MFPLLLSGCASLFNNHAQDIQAVASGGQSDVHVEVHGPSGIYDDTLPTRISAISSNQDISLTVVDKRYKQSTSFVNKTVSPYYYLNILFWPGLLIDYGTGKMWVYDNRVNVYVHDQESDSR